MTKTSHFCLTESFLIMKYLYTLFTLLALSFGFSQETLEDFEGVSAATAEFGGATASIVDDPEMGGTHGKVAQGNSTAGGQVWQGYTFDLNTKNLDLTATKTAMLDVYSDDPGEFAVKVQAGVGGATDSTKNAAHAGTGWETITVDFSSDTVDGTGAADGAYAQIAIYLNWDSSAGNFGTPVDKTFYIDNFVGVGIGKPAELDPPSTAPTTPPARDAADVISIYGEAYGTAIGVTDVGWDGGSTFALETIAENEVMKAEFVDFLGLDLGSEVDATAMTHMHMDIWIQDAHGVGQVFKPKWSNHNGAGETDAMEHTREVVEADSQNWVAIDVALDDLDNAKGLGPAARANLKQLVIGTSATLDVVYIDNIYFYKSATAGIDNAGLTGIKLYPNPVKSTATISADQTVQNVQIYDLTGRVVHKASPNKANFNLDVSHLSKGVYLVKVNAGNQEATLKLAK